jgi:hypothetical protein
MPCVCRRRSNRYVLFLGPIRRPMQCSSLLALFDHFASWASSLSTANSLFPLLEALVGGDATVECDRVGSCSSR